MNPFFNNFNIFSWSEISCSKKLIKPEHTFKKSRNSLKNYSKISNFNEPRYKSSEISLECYLLSKHLKPLIKIELGNNRELFKICVVFDNFGENLL